MHPFAAPRRSPSQSLGQVFPKQVADAEPCKRFTTTVVKQRDVPSLLQRRGRIQGQFLQELQTSEKRG
jgi:hypothetical protein